MPVIFQGLSLHEGELGSNTATTLRLICMFPRLHDMSCMILLQPTYHELSVPYHTCLLTEPQCPSSRNIPLTQSHQFLPLRADRIPAAMIRRAVQDQQMATEACFS